MFSSGDHPLCYDRQGKPISVAAWSFRHCDSGYRVVAQTRLRGWLVSTVWLGLDHSYGQGPPLIFETMVFLPDGSSLGDGDEEYCERYATEAEARDGHDLALNWVAEKIRNGPVVQWRAVPDDLTNWRDWPSD
jgi:hypothetical protein